MLKHKTTPSLFTISVNMFSITSMISASAMAATLVINGHSETEMHGVKTSGSQPTTVSCPPTFHGVAIISDASQCQQFEAQVPAAMVYHSKQTTEQVVAFYQNGMAVLKVHAPVNQRTLLTSENNHTRIVISPDNAGSQIDILVAPKK